MGGYILGSTQNPAESSTLDHTNLDHEEHELDSTQNPAEPPTLDSTNLDHKKHTDLSKNKQCSRALITKHRATAGLGVDMMDYSSKLKLLSTPKGGATVTAQIFLKHFGLMDEALDYASWIHKYRIEVFAKQTNHKITSCDAVCGLPGWTCAKIIRSPLDRIVSSYIHTMHTEIKRKFPQLKMAVAKSSYSMNTQKTTEDASFVDFVTAMDMLRDPPLPRHNLWWDHYIPQSLQNPSCNDHPNIYLLPIEELEEVLAAFANETGVIYNATGLISSHYVSNKPTRQGKGIDFDVHNTWNKTKMKTVPYDWYLTNSQLNIKICEIFCEDIFIYAKACSSTWLQSSQQVQTSCWAERERVISVCGKEYDFFTSY